MQLATSPIHSTRQRKAIWGAIFIVSTGSGLSLGITALILHPGSLDLIKEGFCLLISSILAIAITAIMMRLASSSRGGLHMLLSLPYLVASIVISLPMLIAIPLMFESKEDITYMLVLLTFGAVVSLILASIVAMSLLNVLQGLDGGAQRIAQGDYTARLADTLTRRGDELGRLSRSFNTMAQCVHQAFIRQREADTARRQLIAAISHDLRTPLSSLRAMVEAMADGVVTDGDTMHRYIHTMRNESRHLSALIDDLFEFSRLEVGGVTLKRELTGLDDLLSDTLEAMQVSAHSRGVELQGELIETLPPARIDARLIQRVLYNLVENAIRYTPSGAQVTLRAGLTIADAADGQKSKEVLVEVRDSGEGIPAAALPYIFEPFYRGERARTRQVTHGHEALTAQEPRRKETGQASQAVVSEDGARAGLGLTIAQHIITLHGGQIWAVSPTPSAPGPRPGTSFFFTLPLN